MLLQILIKFASEIEIVEKKEIIGRAVLTSENPDSVEMRHSGEVGFFFVRSTVGIRQRRLAKGQDACYLLDPQFLLSSQLVMQSLSYLTLAPYFPPWVGGVLVSKVRCSFPTASHPGEKGERPTAFLCVVTGAEREQKSELQQRAATGSVEKGKGSQAGSSVNGHRKRNLYFQGKQHVSDT